MSLTTRCTECGTVFRVVPDQLKVSEGWVRCGRCAAVFNAQEELLDPDVAVSPPALGRAGDNDIDTDIALADDDSPAKPPREQRLMPDAPAAPDLALSSADRSRADASPDRASAWAHDPGRDTTLQFGAAPAPGAADIGLPNWHDDPPMQAGDSPDVVVSIGAGSSAGRLATEPTLGPVDTDDFVHRPVDLAADYAADHPTGHPAAAATDPSTHGAAALAAIAIDPDEADIAPSFMRTPDPGALWRRPAVRAGLWIMAAVLTIILAGQAVMAWRDSLAAALPELKPALVQACQWLGCQISAPRRVDQLSVEASGLNRIEGAPLHRLSLTLRNRGPSAVLVPALDLSLTDAQGKLLVRRVLRASELGGVPTTLAAGAELPLQALLSTAQLRISGYTIEIFYP